MTTDERLKGVFASVFGVPSDAVNEHTNPDTLDTWDSLNHINLVLALEGEFGVQFEPGEIAGLNSFMVIRDRLRQNG